MERNLAMDAVRATEAAALASAKLMGSGDEEATDRAAVEAMRKVIGTVAIDGTVVIGEGPEEAMAMLYTGERIGTGQGPKTDVAVDAIEGASTCATGGHNALSAIALAGPGGLLRVPESYMVKLACGAEGKGVVDIGRTPTENVSALAKAKGVPTKKLTIVILDRPRHTGLIDEVRRAGARIKLITDGDVSAALAAAKPGSGVDMLLGSGRAPQGVLAAAAIKCLGGEMQARFVQPQSATEAQAHRNAGIYDYRKTYTLEELAGGAVMFAATGVTPGDFLPGVRYTPAGAITGSVVMRSASQTVRYIEAQHRFPDEPEY